MDQFVDRCGLFAVAGSAASGDGEARSADAAEIVVTGLHALVHRGGVGMSVAASNGRSLRHRTAATRGFELEGLDGSRAIGCTIGEGLPRAPWADLPADDGLDLVPAADPRDVTRLAFGRTRGSPVAIAVNGRFTNGARLRQDLAEHGALFHGPSDSEVLLHLLAMSGQKRFVNRLVDALWKVEGAYALLLLTDDHLVAVRDPTGRRPLVLGKLGEAHVFASEDGALRAVGAEVRRELHPGEMVIVDARGLSSVAPFQRRSQERCAQEALALARTDATVAGAAVHETRRAAGEELGRTFPSPGADLVCAVPGAEALAQGYAEAAGLPYVPALSREPGERRVRAIPSAVEGRTVVLVAPGLATGRDARVLVRRLTEAGARGVHLRIGAPPIMASCPFGVATPLPEELVAAGEKDADPAQALGAWSVAWLPLASARALLGGADLCESCFVPRQVFDGLDDDQLPLF